MSLCAWDYGAVLDKRMNKRTIVITGASSGFGRITALTLASRGWRVFATVRKEADAESLSSEAAQRGYKENLTALLCDVTHPEEVATLLQQVEAALLEGEAEGIAPCLDALLNNAGTAYGGPMELLPLDDLRAQFEVNTFAHVGVTQAFLPMLKAAQGTIINVSSIGARLATPITGAYNASKAALEVISDAWRVELIHFGVHVVLIEPASSPTNIWDTSLERAMGGIGEHQEGSYQRLLTVSEKVAKRSSRKGFPPQLFADTVVRILESGKPRARYLVPRNIAIPMLVRSLLPDRVWDYLVRRTLKW